jgi:hypothetical protein
MAMFKLFTSMMKEEWRIHSTIFGSLSFALFPVMIFGIAFMGSFLIPLFRAVVPLGDLTTIIHAIFVLLGVMVGAFGLLGTEAMNRRFGQASLLAYSARSLPLSERTIYLNFVVKDTVYYFILWVFPFVAGFFVASLFLGIPFTLPLLLLLTLTLAFLSGLSGVFLLSTIYAVSKPVLIVLLAIVASAAMAMYVFYGISPGVFFPPLVLFHSFSWLALLIAITVIMVPFVIAVGLFTTETTGTTEHYPDSIAPWVKLLGFFPNPPLAAKDLIDLRRSGSLIGQTIFSFLIPLGLLWFLLSVLARVLPPGGVLLLFAILTGVIASTMYTWITMFDTFGSYAVLPISVTAVLTSKICSFSVLQIIPAVFIVIIAVASGQAVYLIPALVLCLAVSFYSLGVTIWLTGLSPSVLVYDAKVLMSYLFLVGIAIIIVIALSFINPWYALGAALLGVPAWGLIRLGFKKWEDSEQPAF